MSAASSNLPLWGQAWKLEVVYATANGEPQTITVSTDAWEPEALRITFEVVQSQMPSPWWYADISVYNLNSQDTLNALYNATWVRLSAGFQSGPCKSSVIWDGPVLQVLYDRERVVDQRITFHCVASPLVMENIVNLNTGVMTSQMQLVSKMATQINLPATNGVGVSQHAFNQLSVKQYPRGKTCFGKMGKYLRQIADDNFMQTFRDANRPYISELSAGNLFPTPDLNYSPPFPPGSQVPDLPQSTTQSIVDTPRQTPFGVEFRVLLDPRLTVKVPPLVVQLNYTLVTQLPVTMGALPPVSLSNNNLLFFVAMVRHSGDSRGNEWNTEVTGFGTTYAANLLDGTFLAQSSGGT